jgi:hypothetical protein
MCALLTRFVLPSSVLSFVATGLAAFSWPASSSAQDKPVAEIPPALVERLIAESKAREACKRSICEVVRAKKAASGPFACKVLKTWPAQDLSEKIFKGKMDWKWGHAQCEADVSIDSALLSKIASDPKLEAKIGKHKVSCNLEQADGTATHKLTFSIDPTVTFENGKATKAVLNWSEVDGSTMVKTALWSATAVDNTFNVLQGAVIEQINDFLGTKCDDALK